MHSGSRWVKREGEQHRLAGVKTTEAEVHMATYLISCLRVQIIDGSLATGSKISITTMVEVASGKAMHKQHL